MPRFAANLTTMFTEHAFLDRFAAAAAAGFTAVECQFPYEASPSMIADRLATNGLIQVMFNLPPGDWAAGERGLAALPGRRDAFRASVAVALRYAQATKARRLHVMSGLADAADPAANRAFRDSLSFACDAAGELGIEVMIEPLNPRDMPGYFLNDFNRTAAILADLGLPNLRLQFDIYHRQILHGDVMTGLAKLLPLIGHVQIASVPLRQEPGTGELDDARVLRHLDDLGYDGYVGCEYRPAESTVAGLRWMKAFS